MLEEKEDPARSEQRVASDIPVQWASCSLVMQGLVLPVHHHVTHASVSDPSHIGNQLPGVLPESFLSQDTRGYQTQGSSLITKLNL